MRRLLGGFFVSVLVSSGLMFAVTPAWAVTANCEKWKISEQGGATCTGSGGQWRLHLDCPRGFDYRSNWMTLSSTPTSVQGTCDPWQPRSVDIETRS